MDPVDSNGPGHPVMGNKQISSRIRVDGIHPIHQSGRATWNIPADLKAVNDPDWLGMDRARRGNQLNDRVDSFSTRIERESSETSTEMI